MISSRDPRVAITGLGAFSAAGPSADALWTAAVAGRVTARWLETAATGPAIAGCGAGEPLSRRLAASALLRLARFARLGVAAAEEAWDDAAIAAETIDPRRIAVFVGTSRGPLGSRDPEHARRRGRVRPTAAAYSSSSSLAGSLSALFGARGPSLTISATCASSATAIGVAAGHIAAGVCDVALVGGADAPLHPELLAQMQACGVLGSHQTPALTCRPFDVDRNGTIIGEAAAFLVLERRQLAEQRGARVRGWLCGWSAVCDAGQRCGMSSNARGLQEALTAALDSANVSAAQVDALHLHGTGTVMNDLAEAAVTRRLFGRRAAALPTTSTKPVTGHCLGASGALQAVINIRALQEQQFPPTANCHNLDPDCQLGIVRKAPTAGPLETILTHSAGFWGNHAGLLFRKA